MPKYLIKNKAEKRKKTRNRTNEKQKANRSKHDYADNNVNYK